VLYFVRFVFFAVACWFFDGCFSGMCCLLFGTVKFCILLLFVLYVYGFSLLVFWFGYNSVDLLLCTRCCLFDLDWQFVFAEVAMCCFKICLSLFVWFGYLRGLLVLFVLVVGYAMVVGVFAEF